MWWKSNQKPARKRRAGAGFAAAALALILGFASLCMSGCGADDIDISGYADETITLTGITDDDITLTVADLKEMDCVTVKTESTSDKIGKVRATGPTLDTVLRQFGMSQEQIDSVRVFARDEYDAKLDRRVLESNDIILAFGIDGAPLGEEDAPLRIIIPESDSAYWVRMVQRLEIE
ncbi:MAG: molybdopterin-dependent oxidoreductase [Firmicutes bacterium]|nr:molybdopterin-dependent oxidoreductase [Bacillota bacterium]